MDTTMLSLTAAAMLRSFILVVFCLGLVAKGALLTSSSSPVAYAKVAGAASQALCEQLATSVVSTTGLTINNTFSQYFPEGSMPSLELLTALYPTGTIPKGVRISQILDSVGPDIDVKSDAGYGRANGRAAQNGPTGGLPAFCRYGAYIKTSEQTIVLTEVWLPLASEPALPLAPVNATDFPTNTTSYNIDPNGGFVYAPSYYNNGQYTTVKPAPGSQSPPAPNDVPAVERKANVTMTDASNKTATDTSNDTSTNTKSDNPSTTVGSSGLQSRTSKDLMNRRRRSANNVRPRAKEVSDCLSGEEVLGAEDGWNGRLVVMGNGGQRGFVPLRDMKQLISRYQFAVAGTNLGHFSGTSGVTWVNGTQFDDTILDWASRATHVTMQLAEDVINAFYGASAGVRVATDNNRIRRYFLGSSLGGARGLSAVQVYPNDFHGVLIGNPGQDFMNMNTGQVHIASVHNKTIVGDGWFTQASLYGPIKDVVTRQCDSIDGVKDGIISDPWKCRPDLAAEMLCGTQTKYGASNGTCLTQKQIDTFYELYKPTMIDGQQVYPAYLPGLEDSASSMRAANNKASGWHQLVVLKQDKLNASFNPFTDIRYDDLQRGNAQDPGKANAVQTDLSAFIDGGGKMMMFHGTYDLVITALATIEYFQRAVADTAGKASTSPDDAMKLYIVPGMRHSRDGPGAWHFGGPTQTSPGNRPWKFDTQHDMTLALLAWVERGHAPNAQIAARYVQMEAMMPPLPSGDSSGPTIDLPLPDTQQNFNWGLVNTRLLCPYPKMAKFDGSSDTRGEHGYRAFRCA